MRTLWSIEVHDGHGWYLAHVTEYLAGARAFRDEFFLNQTTRIQKWVRPRKEK